MRIAHILRKYNPAEWGGTETALHRLFAHLHARGVASTVYAPQCAVPQHTPDPLTEVGCDIRRFRACVPVLGLSPAEKQQTVSVGGNLMSFDLPWLLWRQPGLHVIHSHALGRLGGIGLTVAKRRRLPFVVSVHGGVLAIPDSLRQSFDTAGQKWEWGRVFGLLFNSRRLFADADAILTCNDKEAELLREQYPRKRIQVQPHGVPMNQFATDHRAAALAAFPQLRRKDVMLVPGRIDPIKNQNWVVEQTAPILRRHPGALLVLVGACTDKSYGAKVEATIRASGVAEQILVTGGLPPGDPRLIGAFQCAHAVILPSLSETFGLVVLEAWAAGVPVIASRTPGAMALIRHGENGWLFNVEAPATFHKAIEVALIRPELAQQLAAAGQQLVKQRYDSAILATRLQDLYLELSERNINASLRRCMPAEPELAHR